ncbi:MAG: hypothetical protein WC506_04790 [Candidatus Micrarchaeia archaeon]
MDRIAKEISEFMSVPFNRYLSIALALLALYLLIFQQSGIDMPQKTIGTGNNVTISFFYSPGCPHCAAEEEFMQGLLAEKGFENASVSAYNVDMASNLRLMQSMSVNFTTIAPAGVPVTFIGNYEMLVGFDDAQHRGEDIRRSLLECMPSGCAVPGNATAISQNPLSDLQVPLVGTIDLSNASLLVVAAVLGLIDGFNPCAMWVLVYLISLTMSVQSVRRKWLIVATFLLASGILYFLFMTAWLNAFLVIGYFRPITIIVGAFALGAGILSFKEYIDTKGAITCKVEGAEGKKKLMDDMKRIVSSPMNLATMGGIVVLAFVINSVEFVCSSAIPVVFTQALAISNLGFVEHYFYMLVYVFFFMLDDLIVFGMAIFMLSGDVGQKYAAYNKIIGGLIMGILGLMLLFAPNMLA